MKSTKTFTIDDVLSAATGTLCSRRHMEGVYDIMSHLAGRSLMTHELPAAFQMYSPVLLARFPDLKNADVSGLSAENINARATAWAEQFGETLEVESDPDLLEHAGQRPAGEPVGGDAMTNDIDDGGPAFPVPPNDCFGPFAGMNLRDYFAARAMQAIIGKGMDAAIAKLEGSGDYSADDIVEILESRVALSAYRFADAMLAAREEATQ